MHVHTRVWVVKIALAASVQIASKMEGLEIANGTSQHDWVLADFVAIDWKA